MMLTEPAAACRRGLALGIARWLRRNQLPDGRIRDPIHGDTGHYAAGFAALTFHLLGWREAAQRSLLAARRRPATSEFDQLARLLMGDREVEVYTGDRLVSNNWVAMRCLSLALSGQHERARKLVWRVIGWQGPEGVFADSPGGTVAPVTYHAKFCAMLALLGPMLREPEVDAALRRGLEALAWMVSPSGVLVPYGRSRNTLFGYAAAILALSRGGYGGPADRLTARLADFVQGDGHIPCVLNHGEWLKQEWDPYLDNADYNAYAAALLLMSGESPAGPAPVEGAIHLGPLVIVRRGSAYASFSGPGGSHPVGSPFFCDHRYYGMQPLWIESGGRRHLGPAPFRWHQAEMVDPAQNRWMAREGRACVRHYDRFELHEEGLRVRLEGEGNLETYEPTPIWERARGRRFRVVGQGRRRSSLTWDHEVGRLGGDLSFQAEEWRP